MEQEGGYFQAAEYVSTEWVGGWLSRWKHQDVGRYIQNELKKRTYCAAHGSLLNVMCQPGWGGGVWGRKAV